MCDGVDQDCDGAVDEDASDAAPWHADADGDGYGDPAAVVMSCAGGDGLSDNDLDGDDGAATVHPGATEVPDDGVDQDCDGADATSDTGDSGGETGDSGGAGGETGDKGGGCGCMSSGGPTAVAPALLLAAVAVRRRRDRGATASGAILG